MVLVWLVCVRVVSVVVRGVSCLKNCFIGLFFDGGFVFVVMFWIICLWFEFGVLWLMINWLCSCC